MLHPFVSVPAASRPLVPGLALSSSIHVGLVYLVLASQTAVSPASIPRLVSEKVEYIALHAVAAVPTALRRHVAAVGRRSATSAPKPDALPQPIPELAFDIDLPPSTVDFIAPADLDRADLALIGAGVTDADPLRLGLGAAAHGVPDARYNAYDLSAVERGATPDPSNPKPRYPSVMINHRAEVTFSVYFVVDTTGTVDRETLEMPRSIQAEFARAVLDVVFRWRFAPAEMGGRRVRQHVQQPFVFRVE